MQKDTPPPGTCIDRRIPVIIDMATTRSYRENRLVKLSEEENSEIRLLAGNLISRF